ncbi:MAG: sigma-70 family RNA polymerase sigma factor [Bacteroidetes bacterium]|nr:sigma-70 family RNA polymerase sigma factor [Bacteroidota bacterium]MDA0864456.1 sigma-70 family RNA polymerase sigma factor [Bacteroidota bacterium]MDA1210417.1 sigma-70 family RNA polymerase sigma factor [Bacteroidota bacterium]HCK05586.1 RNA polymerase subunit sigma-70 [Flavobacteriaceae bacterium]
MSTEELITRCQDNDRQAQELLYRQYSSVLYGMCLKYAPNQMEAEDNLQDAFITIFQRIGQYQGKGSFEGWMKRIAINTVLQKYRQKRLYDLPADDLIEEKLDEDLDDGSATLPLPFLLSIIQELPERYRLVFNLYVLDGHTHKEIAELLGISDGTSKSNLARARQLLQQKINAFNKANDR